MGELQGTLGREAFVTNESMEEMDFPEDHLETFVVETGPEEYYRSHLYELKTDMKEEYRYWFDVSKVAAAIHHISGIDGFLNEDVLTGDTDGPGLGIEIQYRTDQPYPLRVRISENGWYVVSPLLESEEQLEEVREKSEEDS